MCSTRPRSTSIFIRLVGEDDHDVLQWLGAENNDRYIVTADTIFARDRAATIFGG